MSALSASVTLSRLLTKLHEHALSVPSELALRITDAPLVDRRWLERRYRHARCLHAPALPPLADADRAIVQALEREGAYATSLQALALPGSDGLLEAADGLSASLAERSRKAGFDGRHTVTATAAELLARPEILLWGLSSRLLDIVENYLGLPVACDGLSYYYSRADGRQAGPRLWHRDREDRRMVKIAVYVSDVDEDGGPFELLRPGANAALTTGRAAGYQVLDDGALRSRLGSEAATDAVQTITGARGTVIFTDTARFYHRGRPPPGTTAPPSSTATLPACRSTRSSARARRSPGPSSPASPRACRRASAPPCSGATRCRRSHVGSRPTGSGSDPAALEEQVPGRQPPEHGGQRHAEPEAAGESADILVRRAQRRPRGASAQARIARRARLVPRGCVGCLRHEPDRMTAISHRCHHAPLSRPDAPPRPGAHYRGPGRIASVLGPAAAVRRHCRVRRRRPGTPPPGPAPA